MNVTIDKHTNNAHVTFSAQEICDILCKKYTVYYSPQENILYLAKEAKELRDRGILYLRDDILAKIGNVTITVGLS